MKNKGKLYSSINRGGKVVEVRQTGLHQVYQSRAKIKSIETNIIILYDKARDSGLLEQRKQAY